MVEAARIVLRSAKYQSEMRHSTGANDAYGLPAGLYWWQFAALLVVLYVVVQYRIFKGKMDDVKYGEH